jgi:hypothetical protein
LPKSLNFIGNSEGWITLSFSVHGLGKGSLVKSRDGMGLDSTDEDSSTLDITLPGRVWILWRKKCVCLWSFQGILLVPS